MNNAVGNFIRRIAGLTMLNNLGFRFFNHLAVIQFNMPWAVLDGPLAASATTTYSYRLNTSFAPLTLVIAIGCFSVSASNIGKIE